MAQDAADACVIMKPIGPMARIAFALILSMASLAAPAGAQSAVSPLPRLEMDTYPAAMREAVAPEMRRASGDPDNPAAAGALGRVLHAWEQYGAAHQAYARAQALAPRVFEWQYLDGIVLQRLARHAEAADRFEAAAALDRASLPARVLLAETRLDAGDLERSDALFSGLAREPLAEPRAVLGLGRIAAARGDHAAAIDRFERAIVLFPEWGAAHYALAQSLRATGRPAEAGLALERHAHFGARWPGMVDPVLAAVSALRNDAPAAFRRGLDLAAAGDITGAIEAHEAALRRDPDLPQVHANLIGLYGRTRNWIKAADHYQATVALGFNLAQAHYDYGVILGMQEKWAEAEAAYRHAIAVNGLHAEAHNNLGQMLERRQGLSEAAAEYREAVDARPAFRLARFNLGRMLLALDRPQEAVAALEPLTQPRDAEAPRYLFALATAYIRAGTREEGIKWATAARELALEHRQTDLALAIERDLARLK